MKRYILSTLLGILPVLFCAAQSDSDNIDFAAPAEAIDLGLPSGIKWASWNVGASSPEEYGNYYAWGETEPKETYTWENYKYGYYNYENGSSNMVDIGSDIGGTDYDVAHVKWGGDWRLPTYEEIKELRDNCSYEWTSQNNVIGAKFTGPNGNSIFLPAAGRWYNGSLESVGEWGDYLSSSIRENDPIFFEGFSFNSESNTWYYANPVWGRYHGVSARPVCGGPSPEPYAVLSDEGQTVTFYYDKKKTERNGIEIQCSSGDDFYRAATHAIFDSSMSGYLPTSTVFWFYKCSKLTSITGIEYLNTKYVTDMSVMFCGCESLTSLDLSGFNTQNVIYMSAMFYDCSSLTSLDLSGFNTQNVTDMDGLFHGCSGLTSLDLSGFNTQNVTDMSAMFYDCSSLTSLDLSGFNTQNVTGMNHMFYGCSSLTSLDLIGFNTQNVTVMEMMFYGCSSLTSLDLSGFNTQYVTNMGGMFNGCSGLTSLDLSGFNTQNVTNMVNMFYDCSSLTSLDLSGFNTQNVTDMSYMFYRCSSLTSLDLSGFNTQNVTNMRWMFVNCSSLTNLDLSGFNTQNVTDMSEMFCGCRSLTSLDLSSFNTEKVTTMRMMFQYCNALEELNISSFNTSNVTSMFQMFLACYNLKSLDVSSFDTKNVTTMRWMFGRCSRLTSLDVSGFNTENVYSFSEMFYGCSSLESIDVSNFNTSKVTTMWGMFYGCQALVSIDLSSFNTSNVTNMGHMFYSCSNLRTIYVGEGWTTTNVTESDNMFNNCPTLVGGKGTKYNAEHIDATYAHIDEGTSNPGYFTASGEEPWSDSIGLSDTKTTMYESGTSTIDLSGGSGSYSLQSSDESVAKAEIIGGKLVITCIGEGTATITIIDKATGQTAIVSVTVVPPIKPTKRLYVYVGKKYTLDINGGTGNYSIRSFNESIVTAEFIDSVATITGISEGSTKLEVTDNITQQKDTIEAICIKPTPVHIYTPTVTVYVGKTYPVDINGGTGSYTIQSSNESVVTAQFQDGNAMITGVGVGSATVTVTDEITGQKDSFYVHAIIAPVELSTREVPVVVGNTEKVSIISAGTFTVRSSDESIATATISDKNVVIKGVSEGKVTLTVTNTSTQESETIVVTSYFDSVTPGDLIDLGLPSGTKWASRNIGAGSPTDFGSYFAWGETTPKESYNWANYKYYNWTDRSLTKYCTSSSYGTVDNKTTLDLEDDAAHANWGGDWRMPTHEESSELIDKCQWLRVIINGVLGKKCIGPNGNSIFFPASGVRFDDGLCYKGVDGQYWQSESGDNDLGAWRIYLFDVIPLERYAGLTVRPVCAGTPAHACDLSDIPTTSAYYGPTAFLCDRTVIHGSDEDGRMAVNMPLKRAHLAKIAYRGVNLLNGRQVPATSVTNNFPTIYSDLTTPTEANSYYFQAAKALQYLEYGDGVSAFDRDRLEFNPSDSIERVNVLKALMEAFNIKPDVVGTDNPFPNDDDAKAILKGNPLKFGYIRKAADLGIITKDNDKFRPFDYCLRGEAFIMLYRIMTKIEAGEIKDPNPQIADYFQPLNTTQKTIAMGSGMSMGNFRSYSKTDFAIPGVMPLTFAHSYNSYSTTLPGVFYGQKMVNGVDETYQPMGPGWSHNYQGFVCVIGKGEDMRAVVNIGGRMLVFKSNDSKLVPESFGVYDELKIENGDVVLKTKGQVEYTFSKQSGSKMPLLYLSSIRDRNGNELTLTYADGKNDTKVLSSVSDGNRELTFDYKSDTDLLEKVSDPLGRSISFGYEYNDNIGEYMLSSFTDAEENTTSYSYGDEGQRSTARLLTRIQLPKGNYIENEYDANRRLTQTVTGLNGVPQTKTTMSVTTDYTSTANTKSTVKVERGNNPSTYSYAYNENNAVTSLTGNDDLSISCTYDDNTQPQLPTAVETNSTNISKVEYDDRGNILSVTEKSNSGFGERTVSMSYNSMNDLKSFTDALGNTTYFSYDNSGNLISVSKPEGVTTERTVDSRGLVKTVTNPMGIKTNFDYNEYGNVIETTLPVLDIVSSIKYDAASRPLSITDPLGRTSHTTYNRNDQMTEEVNAMGHTTQYDYDPNGNLTAITNAKGGITTLTYDDATDQLTSIAFAGSTKQYSYNKDGSLNTFTKPDGTRLNYSYDALGRITSDGVNSYSYDSKLRLKSISGNGQTLTYNYDGFNRVSSVGYSGSSSNTVSYGYDDNDNLTSMTYPDGNKVIYQYDNLDRLTSVKAWNGKQVSYSYRKDGQLSSISYPNGMSTTFGYDEEGRMVEKKTTLSNGPVIASYGYVLDKNGKITGQATKEPYDISGPEGNDTKFSYNSGNRITRAGSVNFTFDSNGNTTKRGSDSYTWDVQDRLVSAEGKSYVYDPMGNIRKYGSTEYTIDPLGMGNVLSDTETGASYIYGNGLEMRIVNGVTQYFVTDCRGSVVAIVDDSGNITHKYQYDEFGKVIQSKEADFNLFRYVGKWGVMYNTDTHYYMRARHYDPTIGRFLSEDPIWSTNLYPYADNNPIMGIDPEGKSFKGFLVGAGVGGFVGSVGGAIIGFGAGGQAVPGAIVGGFVISIVGGIWGNVLTTTPKPIDWTKGDGMSPPNLLDVEVSLMNSSFGNN